MIVPSEFESRWLAASEAFEKDNKELAIKLFKELYDDGFGCCATELGMIYESIQNMESAIFWYQKGMRELDSDSFVGLANIYARGQGVEVNLEYAKEVLSIGAEACKACKEKTDHRINLLLGDIHLLENDEVRAVASYRKSYSQGNLIALKRLNCLDKEKGNYIRFAIGRIALFFKVYIVLRKDIRDIRVREF